VFNEWDGNMKKLIATAGFCLFMTAPAFAVTTYMGEIDEELCLTFCDEGVAGQTAQNGTYGPISAVPLPAAGWMLLAGVGGLMALRRRARA
jgi:hypothetical protein